MAFGKDIFCHGIEPYNFRDTDETVATITANVGQSTAIGPKVAIRRNKPFPNRGEVVAVDMGGGKSSSNITKNLSPTITCTHGGEPVIGTIDASIYKKNSFQDNSKYIIERKTRKEQMEKTNPTEVLKQAIGNGKDVLGIINLSETLLRIVAEGVMTMDEAIVSLGDIRKSLGEKADETKANVDAAVEKAKSVGEEYERAREAVGDDKTDALSHRDAEVADDDGEERCIVRRLTPTETARLQGFPDDYTKIDGKDTADAPQFKAHGNSWATPCANFVSVRVEMELRRLGHEGTIKYATCCSGIEAHSVAVRGLDWKSIFFSEIEPFPCRVLAAHYPDTPNLGDMTQIHFDAEKGVITNSHKKGEEYSLPSCFKEAPIQEIPFKEGDLQVFSGGTPCQSISVAGKREGMAEGSGTRSSLAFHYQRIIDDTRPMFTIWENVCFGGDTLVTTETGHRRIADIREGDMVRSFDGKNHRVVRVMVNKDKETIKVTAMGAETLVVTPNHPFYARVDLHNKKNPSKREFTAPEWTPAGNLTLNHYIGYRVDEEGTQSIGMENAYAVGRWLADGSVAIRSSKTHTGRRGGQKARIFISTGLKKRGKLAKELSRLAYRINESTIGDYAINFTFTSDAFFELIKDCGKGARNKKVPQYAYSLIKEEQEELLRGYLDGDGHMHRANEMTYSSSSKELAMGIARLVRNVYHRGVSIRFVKGGGKVEICGRMVNARDSWSCAFVPDKIDDNGKTHLISFYEDGFVWCPIKKIESGQVQDVYNLTVADTHTYEANDIVVHNCGAFSSNGGADFIWFVNKCAESGYAMAWRVLDAQYVMTEEFPRAVPQRRRRIWMVGYKGNDWRIPARIVFELEKNLTANPPTRVPGLGFKTLNEEAEVEIDKVGLNQTLPATGSDNLIGLVMESDDGRKDLLKVSQMIDFSEMPDESDFSKVSMASIYEFAKKVGEPGYIGSVFRTDKKKKKAKVEESTMDLFSMLDAPKPDSEAEKKVEEDNEPEEWVGAEKITPAILENIGNAGILANGRICTMNCHEWTSGIQLTPSTYNAWEQLVKHKDWLKANDLLPEAYDETVCGLSDVLQEDPDEKYNLSWRACFGILKRAETRGKELPPALAIALVSTIREHAGIVKWVALNGRDTKKRETDLTERESAMLCFEKFIASVAKFDEVEAVQPKRKSGSEEDEDEDVDMEGLDVDEYGNPLVPDEEFCGETGTPIEKQPMPELPNGVINVSGGETAATLIASGDAAVGTTQDANVIAIKK